MRTVIFGASTISQYVAESLTQDGHTVTLVDERPELLKEASQKIDISTKVGIATDAKLLGELFEDAPELLLALTDNDEVNLITCSIAKSLGKTLGHVKTVARIQDIRFLANEQVDIRGLFHVDHIVAPDIAVAHRLFTIATNSGLYSESFFQGKALLKTVTIPIHWKNSEKPLTELFFPTRQLNVALIRRKSSNHPEGEIIFPHGQDFLHPFDEVTFIGNSHLSQEIESLIGKAHELPSLVIIVGATLAAIHLAKELQKKHIQVRLIDSSKDTCHLLANELPKVSIVYQPTFDFDFFKTEKIERADVFVACTAFEEKNMQLSLFAKELGCKKVVSVFSDPSSSRIAEKIGITHVVSPRLSVTDHILALARAERISSMVSLYNQQAEIFAVKISTHSPLIGAPLSSLAARLPKELLIAVVLSKGKLYIPKGDLALSAGDEAIIVGNPQHRKLMEKIF